MLCFVGIVASLICFAYENLAFLDLLLLGFSLLDVFSYKKSEDKFIENMDQRSS